MYIDIYIYIGITILVIQQVKIIDNNIAMNLDDYRG